MPELTVAMPAFRAGRWIAAAIDSVLAQDDVDLELVVVDDASGDDTVAVVQRFSDARIRLLRNDARRGIGHCHNRVIEASRSPFIAHVDADDFILPGALRRMLAALHASPHAGQAYCDHFPVAAGAAGGARPPAVWLARLQAQRNRPRDLRRDLLVHGMVVNHLRTYPRHVLDNVGRFDESLPWAVDYQMALRIAAHYDFVRVPEPLYAKRIHDSGTTERLRFKPLRYWWMRYRIGRRLLRANGGRLLGRSTAAVNALLLLGLIRIVARSM